MNNIRKQHIYFFYKKAYENQSVFLDGVECDLSLLWNSVESRIPKTVKISTILRNINKFYENKYPAPFDHPILMHHNRIIDGHSVLLNKIKNNKKTAKIIKIRKEDIDFSRMDRQ